MSSIALSPKISRSALDSLPIFECLSDETKAALLSRAVLRRLARDELWNQRIEPARGIAIILKGGLRSVATTADGREFVFSIFRKGDIWGVVSTIDGAHNANDVYAHGPTSLLSVDRRVALELIDQYGDFRDCLMQLLCRRLRLANTVLEDRALQPLEVRLGRLLLTLREPAGPGSERAQVTQEMLSKILCCSRPTISKKLRVLADQGMISLAYGHVRIIDEEALAAFLGGGNELYF